MLIKITSLVFVKKHSIFSYKRTVSIFNYDGGQTVTIAESSITNAGYILRDGHGSKAIANQERIIAYGGHA